MDAGWEVAPGQTLTRGEIHDRYGGGRRGGMEPSGQTPNVLLFSKPEAGLAFGYTFDGWREDGTYHYTGEGQSGDQVFTHGNRAALLHVEQGRALRLFESSGTQATYVGEFRLADPAFYRADGLDIDGLIRSLIVFRLQPMGDAVSVSTVFIENGEVEAIPLEALDVEAFIVQHPDEPALAVRREAQLVARYVAELHRAGIATCRQSIPMTGGAKLFTDLYDLSRNELIEAKASAARASLRLGLGQILDYARFVGHESKSLLVPVEPPADMLDLLASYGVGCIWETPSGFVRFP